MNITARRRPYSSVAKAHTCGTTSSALSRDFPQVGLSNWPWPLQGPAPALLLVCLSQANLKLLLDFRRRACFLQQTVSSLSSQKRYLRSCFDQVFLLHQLRAGADSNEGASKLARNTLASHLPKNGSLRYLHPPLRGGFPTVGRWRRVASGRAFEPCSSPSYQAFLQGQAKISSRLVQALYHDKTPRRALGPTLAKPASGLRPTIPADLRHSPRSLACSISPRSQTAWAVRGKLFHYEHAEIDLTS